MALIYRRGKDARSTGDATRVLMEQVRQLLALGEDDAVSVSELQCGGCDCGDAETVILLMRVGKRTEAFKIGKAMAQVTNADLKRALWRE